MFQCGDVLSLNKLKKIKTNIALVFDEQGIENRIYLIAFSVFLLGEMLSTTMFPVPGKVFLLCKGIAVLMILIKVLFCDIYSVRFFWSFVISLGVGILIYLRSGYMEPILWIIMLFGAKNVSFKKILQSYLIVNISVMVLAFVASMMNIIENLQYTREQGIQLRNSFGIIYPTDFASHVFFIMAVIFFVMRGKLKVWHYIVSILIAALTYYFCYTRLDVGCIFILIAVFLFADFINKKNAPFAKYKKNTTYKMSWIIPFLAAAMYVASKIYRSDISILVKLNTLMSNRLALGKKGLSEYGMTPFGQYIDMVGNGGSMVHVKDYFFIDCSYLYVYLKYGIVFFLMILLVSVLCCRKQKKDLYFLMVMAVIGINCMIAHHIIELAYNPFFLILFADTKEHSKLGSMKMNWRHRYVQAEKERS